MSTEASIDMLLEALASAKRVLASKALKLSRDTSHVISVATYIDIANGPLDESVAKQLRGSTRAGLLIWAYVEAVMTGGDVCTWQFEIRRTEKQGWVLERELTVNPGVDRTERHELPALGYEDSDQLALALPHAVEELVALTSPFCASS